MELTVTINGVVTGCGTAINYNNRVFPLPYSFRNQFHNDQQVKIKLDHFPSRKRFNILSVKKYEKE